MGLAWRLWAAAGDPSHASWGWSPGWRAGPAAAVRDTPGRGPPVEW